jgi:phage FluMu gp28-like protein
MKSDRPAYVPKGFAGRCGIFPKDPGLFLPFQRRWILDSSRFKIWEKARQTGASWTASYRAVRELLRCRTRLDTWVASRDEVSAKLFLVDCRHWGELLHAGAQDLGRVVTDPEGNASFVLRFANGRALNSMTSNPDAQRGKRGARVLDEFAWHPAPKEIYAAARPGVTWSGASIELISTHHGTANYFNKLLLEARHAGNPKNASLHRTTLQSALEEGLLYRLQTKLPPNDPVMEMDESSYFDYVKASCPDSETFAEEYECVASDDASAFISYQLLDACTYQPNEKWELSLAELRACPDPLYLGADFARVKDLTVFWVVRAVSNFRPTVHVVALRNVEFSEQVRRLYELLELQMMRRASLDNSGLGRQMCEDAQKRFGYKVEPVQFTMATKETLAFPLRAAFEDRSARIPNDAKIIASHRAIRKEVTSSGNTRFVAERTEAGHADFFWGHALALHAAKTSVSNAITSVEGIRYERSTLLLPWRRRFTPRLAEQGARQGYFET